MSKVKSAATVEDLNVRGLTPMDVFRLARIINGCSKETKNAVLQAIYPDDEQVTALAEAKGQLQKAEAILQEMDGKAHEHDLEPEDVQDYVRAYREGRVNVGGDMTIDIGRLVFALSALMDEREQDVSKFLADLGGIKPEEFSSGSIDLALEIMRQVYEQESERLGAFFTRVSGVVSENSGSL